MWKLPQASDDMALAEFGRALRGTLSQKHRAETLTPVSRSVRDNKHMLFGAGLICHLTTAH